MENIEELINDFKKAVNEYLNELRQIYIEDGLNGLFSYHCSDWGIGYDEERGFVEMANVNNDGSPKFIVSFIDEVYDALQDEEVRYERDELLEQLERENWTFDDWCSMTPEELLKMAGVLG